MPKILAFDVETTGLDVTKDRILTFGMVLLTFEEWHVHPIFEKITYLHHDTYPLSSPEAEIVHGISRKHSEAFGEDPTDFYRELAVFIDKHGVDYLCAHNAHNFDVPMLINNADEYCASLRNFFRNMRVIDTMCDLPVPGNRLSYLAADHGFLNPFPHSALSDVRTMVKIIQQYPIPDIIKRSHSPLLTLIAHTKYEDREKAKRAKFFWDSASQRWLKKLKECDLEKFKTTIDFEISVEGK